MPVWEPGVTTLSLYLATRGATLDIQTQSLFINDRWQLNENWSFNIGARYEQVDSEATGGLTTIDTDAFAPRLGASWDPKGDGRWKVDATYAEYAGRYNPSIFGRNSPVGNPLGVYYVYLGPPGVGRDHAPGYDVTNPAVYEAFNAADPTANVFFEDGTNSPKVEEFTISFGFQLPKGGYGKATFVDRSGSDFVEDFILVQNGCTDVIVQGVNAGCFDNIVNGNSDTREPRLPGPPVPGPVQLHRQLVDRRQLDLPVEERGELRG